jgi:hypothetical protein
MKFIQKHDTILAIVFTVMLLLQSCTIYRDAPATLDEAVASKRNVRVQIKSGEKTNYKKVIKKEAQYYGIIRRDTVQIEATEVVRIQLKNRTLSTIGTVFISGIGAIALMIGTIAFAIAVY